MKQIAIGLLLAAAFVGGCGDDDDEGGGGNPTPASGGSQPAPTQGAQGQTSSGAATDLNVTVYFAKTGAGGLTVVPAARKISAGGSVGMGAMEAMIAGPNPEEIAQGFTTAIPGTAKLIGLTNADGVATVNFRAGSLPVSGSETALIARRQVERTLRQFPGVTRVVIQVEGKSEGVLEP